ncbi:MAG TPA: glycoside hydrolase family 16 protein [Propionicimonas sp.]
MPKDASADLAVSPVDDGGRTVVVARFGDPVATRLVSLQLATGSGWHEVASGEQDQKGTAEFLVETRTATYRAVALELQVDGATLAAVSTPKASAREQWKSVFSDGFDGSTLKSPWAVRFPGLYYQSRWCSGSYPSMVKLKGGVLSLGVAKASAARTRQVRAQAARETRTKASRACRHGVYDNGMISTEGRTTFRYGTFAVRMKFPYQTGMHAAAWMQTPGGKDVEIDFIETFGYGSKGIQNMLHPKSAKGERLDVGDYVNNVPGVQSREWWDQYHVATVEWSPKGYVFRIDGVETFRTSKATSSKQKFFVLSLLSSDYETDRLNPRQLPASLKVDWVKIWQKR